MTKKMFGQVGRLRKDKIDEYEKLHSAVWPDVLKTIKECNLNNYSIFLKEDVVFAYFEYDGLDYEADMRHMAEDPVTQKWWSYTKPCFTSYSETSKENFYEDMKSIFYLE